MSCYRHISSDERNLIGSLHGRGWSARAIARRLGRAPSTVSRELRRGRWFASNENESYRPYRPGRLKSGAWTGPPFYSPLTAQRRAERRARLARRAPRMDDARLLAYVLDGLRAGWSPRQIEAGLARSYPGDPGMRVCHESIYQWIYAPANHGRGLWRCLPRARPRRRARRGRRAKGARIPMRTPIAERPAEVDDRLVFGHWESDTVIGSVPTRTCLHTCVERRTRFLVARLIPDKSAAATTSAELDVYAALPAGARASRTWDNGSEASGHLVVDRALGMACYFADPFSPWQRGSNENRNGQLRRYFPKGHDLSQVSQDELDQVVAEINNRPMLILGGQSPAQAFTHELHQLQSHQETNVLHL